jgi:hypothetical protein
MARAPDKRLLDILKEYGETQGDAMWDCHGTWVIYHRAIERIAAKAGVTFDMPEVVEANSAAKTATIIARGFMGDRSEWSFGEACPANNKNAYPFAMAEKRAKDRVVLKLVGLHGLAYSEEESDDFKPVKSSASLKREGAWEDISAELEADLLDCGSLAALEAIKTIYRGKAADMKFPPAWMLALKDRFDSHEAALVAALNSPIMAG